MIAAAVTGIEGGGNYLAAAYLVFLAIVLIYVAIMASKLVRIERKIGVLEAHMTPSNGRGPATAVNEPDQ